MSNNNAIGDYYQWWDESAPNTTYTYSSNTTGGWAGVNTTGSGTMYWSTDDDQYYVYRDETEADRNIKVADLIKRQEQQLKECTCIEDHDLITVAEFKEFIKDLILNKKNGNLPDYDDWKEIKQMMDRIYDPEKCECSEPSYVEIAELEGSDDIEDLIAQQSAGEVAKQIDEQILQYLVQKAQDEESVVEKISRKYLENVSYSGHSYEFVAITPFETTGGIPNNMSTQWYNSVADEVERTYTNTAFLGC